MPDFNPSLLILARKRRGLTKVSLAQKLHTSARSLFAYETGGQTPPLATVSRMADVLEFPVEFFYGPDLDETPIGGASFRALSKLSAVKEAQALSAATLALAFSDWIDERFMLPKVSLPKFSGMESETAADATRVAWKMEQKPIKNMIHSLENHGIRVFSLSEEYKEVDAFSFWRNGIPFVFLNTFKTAERARMDAAHELGHLILHRNHDIPQGKPYELEAQTFASAFLMPKQSVIAYSPRGGTLDDLIVAKRRWKVSASALAHRMHKLGMLSDWQYRSIHIELSRRGYSTSEPEEIPRETSELLRLILADLRSAGTSKAGISRELRISAKELDRMIFGLALTSIEGGSRSNEETRREKHRY